MARRPFLTLLLNVRKTHGFTDSWYPQGHRCGCEGCKDYYRRVRRAKRRKANKGVVFLTRKRRV